MKCEHCQLETSKVRSEAGWHAPEVCREVLKERVVKLESALKPLVDIANAYDAEGLDEARPSWKVKGLDQEPTESIELYTGRGGGRLLTLGNCFEARAAVKGIR